MVFITMKESIIKYLVLILIVLLIIDTCVRLKFNGWIYSRTKQTSYNPQFKDHHKEVDRVRPLYENLPDIIFRNHFINGCRTTANLTGGSSQMIMHSYKNCEACREALKRDIREVLKELN